MKFKIILASLAFLFLPLANASISGLANPCKSTGVNHLHVQGFEKFKNLDVDADLCQRPEILQAYPQLANVAKSVNAFLDQISVQFNLPMEQIVPKGINLQLKANSLGEASSSGDGESELTITEYPNWDGIMKSPFILVHELAHFIPDHISADTPLHTFGHVPFLEEGFPDLLAAFITQTNGLEMTR